MNGLLWGLLVQIQSGARNRTRMVPSLAKVRGGQTSGKKRRANGVGLGHTQQVKFVS